MSEYIYICLTAIIGFLCIVLALDRTSEVVKMATSNKSVISAADKFLILLQIGVLIALGFFYNEYKVYKESILSLTEQYIVYVKEVEDIKAKVDNFKQQLSIFDKNIKEKCEILQNTPINERTITKAIESIRKEAKSAKDK